VVDPPWGWVLGGEVVDVVDRVVAPVVDVVEPVPDLPGWGFGAVVVVVVDVLVVADGAAPSTCWAWLSCWSIAVMSCWYAARLPSANAAFALL
jgi:hypothetical protein